MNETDLQTRRDAARQRMREEGIDLLVVGPSENMTYLLGFHPHPDERPCMLFLTADPNREVLIMPALNAAESRQFTSMPMTEWSDDDGPDAAMAETASLLGLGSVHAVAFDETMRSDFALLVMRHCPDARFQDASPVIGHLRMRKSPSEHEWIAANAVIADGAMQAAFAAVRAGASEREVADAARDAFKAGGVDQVNFTIIASGPNGAYPHHHTGERRLAPGDLVVLDIGARKDSYNSDITRMASVGAPSERQATVLAVVEEAVQAGLAAVRSGARAMDVDRAARGVIEAAGFGPYFVHRTGHGLGLTGHEPPYITATNDFVLDEGMTFSIEPGIYLPGEFGVRLEEIVRVAPGGAEIFSSLPRTLHLAG